MADALTASPLSLPSHHTAEHTAREHACQTMRRVIRAQRRALSSAAQHDAAAQACQHFLTLLAQLPNIQHVALYLSYDGELDTRPLFAPLWQRGIRTYLPVLHPFSPGHLLFLHYHAQSKMGRNRFGIEEPLLDIRLLFPANKLDLILTPLVAFDSQGNRIGMGGGFYDRLLSRQPHTLAVGYAHGLQQQPNLPLAPWDQPLAVVITPSHILDNRSTIG